MKNKKVFFPFVLLLFMAFYAVEDLPFYYPTYFPKPVYNFDKNPLNEEKVELGRHLFYDTALSKDNSISCASCHSSNNAFAHSDDLSRGISDSIGNRNAPTLFNLAWQSDFMWDGSILYLDFQALAPINHPKEMGETTNSVVIKLNTIPKYRKLFFKAYGDSMVTAERMLKALSQFQLTLVSASSKYDFVKQEKAEFTKQEERGYAVFLSKCNSCHTEPLFTNYQYENIGLPLDKKLNDYGKGTATKLNSDKLKFKTPTLRNLSYSFPYMHDGRFENLSEVLEHYTNGIEKSPTLSKELTYPIIFSSVQKEDLLAFMRTLDDSVFVNNPKYQIPK